MRKALKRGNIELGFQCSMNGGWFECKECSEQKKQLGQSNEKKNSSHIQAATVASCLGQGKKSEREARLATGLFDKAFACGPFFIVFVLYLLVYNLHRIK